MKIAHVNVNQWVDMFRSIGLNDKQMHDWHAQFERRHPDAQSGSGYLGGTERQADGYLRRFKRASAVMQ